jgi:Flp pilus assembly protein TadG
MRCRDAFGRSLRSMRARSRLGSAAIEFAMVAPVLFLFLFGIIETGVIFFLDTALQNATKDAARLVRTGSAQTQGMTAAQFTAQICGEMSGAISLATCEANLQVDMRAYANFGATSYPPDLNANGSVITANMLYQPGNSCDVVIVRAFYSWKIMTPLMTPLLQNMPNGNFLLSAATAYRNEPFVSGASC